MKRLSDVVAVCLAAVAAMNERAAERVRHPDEDNMVFVSLQEYASTILVLDEIKEAIDVAAAQQVVVANQFFTYEQLGLALNGESRSNLSYRVKRVLRNGRSLQSHVKRVAQVFDQQLAEVADYKKFYPGRKRGYVRDEDLWEYEIPIYDKRDYTDTDDGN